METDDGGMNELMKSRDKRNMLNVPDHTFGAPKRIQMSVPTDFSVSCDLGKRGPRRSTKRSSN